MEWIPVSERLPEEDDCYLGAFTIHKRVTSEVVFEDGKWIWYFSNSAGITAPVTHWMPLPAPPSIDE